MTTFDSAKRKFELAYKADKRAHTMHSSDVLANASTALAKAIAYSVVKTCIDPQRKTATQRETVSNSGLNRAMVQLRRDIYTDCKALDDMRRIADLELTHAYNDNGDIVEAVDSRYSAALDTLVSDTLGDGIDLVQTAQAMLYQAAADSWRRYGWLDDRITVRKLKRTVLLSLDGGKDYTRVDTSAIQEAYRAVRRYIQSARSVSADPRSKCVYIEDYSAEGIDGERVYRRLERYSGTAAPLDPHDPQNILCNAGEQELDNARIISNLLDALELTPRQITVVKMRLQGASVEGIAAKLSVTSRAVRDVLSNTQDKAAAAGLFPADLLKQARDDDKDMPRAVVQMDKAGNVLAVYDSSKAAARATGVNVGSISHAASGARDTAGGYKWALQ